MSYLKGERERGNEIGRREKGSERGREREAGAEEKGIGSRRHLGEEVETSWTHLLRCTVG